MTWQIPNLSKFDLILQIFSPISPWKRLPISMRFYILLHICLGNLHLKSYENWCPLRVLLTLKITLNYFSGHSGAIFGYLRIIRFGSFFYWSTNDTQSFTVSNFMILLFREVDDPPQKCPKMAVFWVFYGAIYKSNPRRDLGVAPLNSPCFFT